MRPSVAPLVLLLSLPLSAQELTRVLLPVYTGPDPIPGANGVSFATDLRVYNDQPFRYRPAHTLGTIGEHRAFSSMPQIAGPNPTGNGRLIEVERDVAPAFELKVRSSQATAFRIATVPVVPEQSFCRGISHMLGVPELSAAGIPYFRHRLRVAALDGTGTERVRIRFVFQDVTPQLPLRTLTVALDRRDGSDPSYPWYASVTLENVCLPLGRPAGCAGHYARVEVEPEDPNLRYWPFVSSTNNLTSEIAISAPTCGGAGG